MNSTKPTEKSNTSMVGVGRVFMLNYVYTKLIVAILVPLTTS